MPVLDLFDPAGALLPDAGLRLRRIMRLRTRGAGAVIDLRHGFAAGFTLMSTWALNQSAPRKASPAQAMRLIAKHSPRAGAAGVSLRSLEAAWSRYRDVASLYAGWFWCVRILDSVPASEAIPDDVSAVPFIVDAGEVFRTFAENHHPPICMTGARRSAKPLLDPAKAWRCPENAVLPCIPLHLFNQSLTGDALDMLPQAHRARR